MRRGAAGGTDVRSSTAPRAGLLQARLAGSGDWDVAVFDASSRDLVAASAGFGATELVEGFVRAGQRLLVQACRYAGGTDAAALTTEVRSTSAGSGGGTAQVVCVRTPIRADKTRLQGLGLDLTEHGTETTVDVVPAAGRLRAGDEAAGGALPAPRPAVHPAAPHRRGPRGARHRDHPQRRPGRRRQGVLPAHGPAPRPGVAVRRARHGVRVRPAQHLPDVGPHRAAGRRRPDHRRPGDQPGRVHGLPRGGPDRRLRPARLRDEAQELERGPGAPRVPRRHLRRRPGRRLRGTDLNRNYAGFWGGPGIVAEYLGRAPSPGAGQGGRYRGVLVDDEGGESDDGGAGQVLFSSPAPAVEGRTEAWVLTCERPSGTVASARRVVVDRGETARLGDVCGVKQDR